MVSKQRIKLERVAIIQISLVDLWEEWLIGRSAFWLQALSFDHFMHIFIQLKDSFVLWILERVKVTL